MSNLQQYTKDQIVKHMIRYSIAHGGNYPTVREIATTIGVAASTVHYYLDNMIIDGEAYRADRKIWLSKELIDLYKVK